MEETGIILKAISGFYYVEATDAVYTCKAKGAFRKQGITPLVGDRVTIRPGPDNNEAVVTGVLPRKNALVRPPVANVDILALVLSTCAPRPNLLIADQLIAAAEKKGICPVILITKTDLSRPDALAEIYRRAGFVVIAAGESPQTLLPFVRLAAGKITVFTGNSGVGKSTLLNRLDETLRLETGEISEKLGRGRHTTRHAQLYPFAGGYLADTPGFSAVDMLQYELLEKEELPLLFREFAPYLDKCRFTGCSHTVEKGCAVLEAVGRGEICPSRHESYCRMYAQASRVKPWAQGR